MKERRLPTHDELWDAQLREYPSSVRMSEQDIAMWAYAAVTGYEQQRRLARIGSSLVDPVRVYYRTANRPTAHIGCRYGVDGADYTAFTD